MHCYVCLPVCPPSRLQVLLAVELAALSGLDLSTPDWQ